MEYSPVYYHIIGQEVYELDSSNVTTNEQKKTLSSKIQKKWAIVSFI